MTSALTREQLEERLAALHRASLDLIQDTSLDSLLERIARVACEQSGAQYAAVGVQGETGEMEKFIHVGMSPAEVAQMPHPPRGLGLIGALAHSRQTIRLRSIAADARSVGFPQHHPAMESFLGVPILSSEKQLGQIYLTNKTGADEFSSDDELVIETLAAYASIAISNARLYAQLIQRDQMLTRRNENLALLNELASTLASSADIDQILDKALTQMMNYLRLEVGEIYLREDDNSRALKLMLHRADPPHSLWRQDVFAIGEGMVGLTARSGQPRILNLPDDGKQSPEAMLTESDIHQVACFPLAGRRGVLGVLCVATYTEPLNEMEIQLLSAMSSWVGTGIENVRLNTQQRRLAILEERERIGMDLHDGIIQSIYAVRLTLEHARLLMVEDRDAAQQRIEQAINDLNHTIRDIRTYILDLRPRQLHDENLLDALQRLVSEFRANTLVEVNLVGTAKELENLPDAQAVAIFHICQETLTNIAKHGHARHVDVSIWTTTERVLLEVRDDGRGFDPGKMKTSLGHGLENMQTRAHNAGGDLEITSEPGAGTSILVWVPLSNEN